MRREHEWPPGGHIVDVVDEPHAELAESVDDPAVVHDLVVAVHGRLEGSDHPRERLDGHLDPGAEPARRGEQYPIDIHGGRVGARPTGPVAAEK